MKSNTTTVTETTLVLNEKEVEWLKSYIRDPKDTNYSIDERKPYQDIHNSFWTALGGSITK